MDENRLRMLSGIHVNESVTATKPDGTTYTQKEFDDALKRFMKIAKDKVDKGWNVNFPEEYHKSLGTINGRRYIKVFVEKGKSNRSLFCFIDKSTGQIFKGASWNAPAPGARGSIFNDDHGGKAIDEYGAVYAR